MANVLQIFVSKLRFAGAFRKLLIHDTTQFSRVLVNQCRHCTHASSSTLTESERRITEKIKSNLNVSRIEVEDISGGCGSMYRIVVASCEFKGKRTLQQHRIITNILQDEVKDMHGLTIETAIS